MHRVGAINDAFCPQFIISDGNPIVLQREQSDSIGISRDASVNRRFIIPKYQLERVTRNFPVI